MFPAHLLIVMAYGEKVGKKRGRLVEHRREMISCQFMVFVKTDGGRMRKAADKWTTDVLFKLPLGRQRAVKESIIGGDVAIFGATFERILGCALVGIDVLARSRPFWRSV